MSSITHLFPPVAVKNEGKATKRKRVRIPTLNAEYRHQIVIPDSVVCGILWLCDAGWLHKHVAELVCTSRQMVQQYWSGTQRPHATPKMPDSAFWEWVEKRRDSQKLSTNDHL